MRFVGGEWKPDTRAGTFRRFLEAHASLDRESFARALPWPHLLIGYEPDPTAWDRCVVLRVAPAREGSVGAVVGRSEGEADIVLNCPTLSNRHAVLLEEGGRWMLRDLGSSGGTYLDGVAVSGPDPKPLPDGPCTIDFGPDVRAELYRPTDLHACLAEARASRPGDKRKRPLAPRVAASEGREPWPTWSLLQSPGVKTDTSRAIPAHVLPPGAVAVREEVVSAPTERKSWWATQLSVMFGTRPRTARTLVIATVVGAIITWIARPLALLLFGNSHPDWFSTH